MNSIQTTVLLFFVIATLAAPATAFQESEKRVPSGDLSAFFNPPGATARSSSKTTTRTIDSKSSSSKKSTSSDKSSSKSSKSADTAGSGTKKASATTASDTKTDKPDITVSTTERTSKKKSSTSKKKASPPEVADNGFQVQIDVDDSMGELEGGVSFGEPSTINWRVGVLMATGSNAVQNVICRIPVPTQWPEQTVSVENEDFPTEITDVTWEKTGNIKFLKFRISAVPAGEKFVATVTFRVTTNQIIAPKNPSIFRIPERKTRDIKAYYSASPEIEIRDSKMKKQAKEIFANSQSDWNKVQALYDWVRDNIEERSGTPVGATKAFQQKFGTGEDRVSLFVAMCRINKVPARMVFVDGTQYAEFHLVDDKEVGHWFPCKVSGIREFGEIGEPKVILQKGDNYRVSGEKKKLKFVPAKATVRGTKPARVLFVREPMSAR